MGKGGGEEEPRHVSILPRRAVVCCARPTLCVGARANQTKPSECGCLAARWSVQRLPPTSPGGGMMGGALRARAQHVVFAGAAAGGSFDRQAHGIEDRARRRGGQSNLAGSGLTQRRRGTESQRGNKPEKVADMESGLAYTLRWRGRGG